MLRKAMIGIALTLPLMGALAACDDKGPAEKAGEKLDNAADEMKDAVNPQGPAEKTGEKIDNATGN
ncbi:MAG: hypothetical protein K8R18_08605 [Parvibaculum sp.]|uniref:hypothetical protein n=1 Tax=Parvibaculum sp. TaxID=2024848 RepID=UPI0025D913B5|nr:hypothetical protein [Parvibaculum sp.]MCE9649667.1 hypothetical protein [Parvibaculum sp.]